MKLMTDVNAMLADQKRTSVFIAHRLRTISNAGASAAASPPPRRPSAAPATDARLLPWRLLQTTSSSCTRARSSRPARTRSCSPGRRPRAPSTRASGRRSCRSTQIRDWRCMVVDREIHYKQRSGWRRGRAIGREVIEQEGGEGERCGREMWGLREEVKGRGCCRGGRCAWPARCRRRPRAARRRTRRTSRSRCRQTPRCRARSSTTTRC